MCLLKWILFIKRSVQLILNKMSLKYPVSLCCFKFNKIFFQEFDLVLIAERMDESLILMKDLLCWDLKDLTYLKQNVRRAEMKSNMTTMTRQYLKKWLWAGDKEEPFFSI